MFTFSFFCLHHCTYLYTPFSNDQTLNWKYNNPPTYYYVEHTNGERFDAMIGYADFLVYGILLLLLLSPPLSMTIKILVTLGYIISVQVGYVAAIEIFEMV